MDNLPIGMKLRQLEYFLALAEDPHFTRAAESLFVTQPTLSHQLAQLEERVGTPLLHRVGKKVQLTEAGEIFRAYASRAIHELKAGQDALRELEGLERGDLRIGIIQSFCFTLLPSILEQFFANYPSIKVRIESLTATAIEEGLAAATLDLGIAFTPVTLEDIDAEPILDERLLLVGARSHPLLKRRSCAMASLHGQRIALLNQTFSTRRLIDQNLAAAGAVPEVVCETNAIEALRAVVLSGKVLTILPERAFTADASLVGVALRDPSPVRTSALLWNRHMFRSAAARTFAGMVRERFSTTSA
ncbi:MAG: transcriptional regulator CynR [Pseudomonadota bacterium]